MGWATEYVERSARIPTATKEAAILPALGRAADTAITGVGRAPGVIVGGSLGALGAGMVGTGLGAVAGAAADPDHPIIGGLGGAAIGGLGGGALGLAHGARYGVRATKDPMMPLRSVRDSVSAGGGFVRSGLRHAGNFLDS